MQMDYIRLAKGGVAKYELLPINTDISQLINANEPNYVSLYKYNDKHYEFWKKNKTVSGITDTSTDQLYFDFDSADDLETARKDAVTTIRRLYDNGVTEDNIEIAFTGKKGFSVAVKLEQTLTPKEFKKAVAFFAGDLSTFDTRINDANRLVRLPLTKHQDTNLYKIPLTFKQLERLSIEKILQQAASPEEVPDRLVKKVAVPVNLEEALSVAVVEDELEEVDLTPGGDPNHIDFSLKPRWLDKSKYILHLGLFPRGAGISNDAYMTLAATYKNQGFTAEQTMALLKEVAKKQAATFNCEPYSSKELQINIIDTVYSPHWNNGQYTYENNRALQWVVKQYNLQSEMEVPEIVSMSELSDNFKRFATNIDQNTIKLGIDSIDSKIRVTTSMLTCLLAAPSAGKTSIALEILKNTSMRGISSFFFSLDMAAPLVYQRMLQKELGMHSDKLFDHYKNEDRQVEVFDKTVVNRYNKVNFCFKSGLDAEGIKRIIIETNEKQNDKVRLVVIDYLECIQGPYSDPTANTSMIAQQLKDIANELDVMILLLVQPQKHAGDPSSELLSYRQIKGASAIEQAASVIFTLWRPGFSAKNPDDDDFASIAVVKNRMGSLGKFDFYWNGLTGELGEIDFDGKQRLKELQEKKAAEKADKERGGYGSSF